MKLSDYIVDYLTQAGIKHGFFMIGGALGHIADSCALKKFKLYTMHHEQAAAFAAEGQAAATQKPGLAMATSGPGATNLITGIGSAYYASTPTVFITGQVNTFESNIGGKRRQVGFQETDIVSIIRPITKYAMTISDPGKVCYELEKAVFLATHGRNGPVLIDFPLDVQRADISPAKQEHFTGSKEHNELSKKKQITKQELDTFSTLLSNSERPMILAGHGVRLSKARDELRKFAEKTKIPVVASLMGTDSLPSHHPLYYGFIGTYGGRHANFALANADLIIVFGARLDSRQIGVQALKFAPAAKIIHIDIDSSELGASVKEELSINADIKEFLSQALAILPGMKPGNGWKSHLKWLKEKYGTQNQDAGRQAINPVTALGAVSKAAKEESFVSVDVGAHQMWFAQAWQVKKNQTIFTNGGMGPMGCAIPTAIGAWLSDKSKSAWAVCGDGGFQLNIQELQTIVRNNIPLKIIILNNKSLGMLTQFQSENFEGRLIGSMDGYDTPDFVKVSNAYKIPAKRAEHPDELEEKISWLANEENAAVLEIIIPNTFWTFPKATYSKPVYDMKPYLTDEEMQNALKYVWEACSKKK
ncbi:MAG: thiamine pyrophosphate-binding protein [Candidatus Micrarchaeota archaeon]